MPRRHSGKHHLAEPHGTSICYGYQTCTRPPGAIDLFENSTWQANKIWPAPHTGRRRFLVPGFLPNFATTAQIQENKIFCHFEKFCRTSRYQAKSASEIDPAQPIHPIFDQFSKKCQKLKIPPIWECMVLSGTFVCLWLRNIPGAQCGVQAKCNFSKRSIVIVLSLIG